MRIAIAVLMLALSSVSNMAQAAVSSSLSGPGSILAGGTATFNAHISDSVSPGYDWEYITGVNYTFNAGDGQTHSGSLDGLWTTSLDLSTAFDYGTTGIYTPSFSATVTTTAQYHYWVDTSYYQNSGYWQSYYCGIFCGYRSYWVDTSHWVYQGYDQYVRTNLQFNTFSSTNLDVAAAPVPEPETYAMMMAGLGLLGLMARRRKQKLNA